LQPKLNSVGAVKEAENKMGRKTTRTSDQAEEVACIRAYDAAKASGETPIPYEQVLQTIERRRKGISRRAAAKKTKT